MMVEKSFSSNKELMNYLKDSGNIKSDFVYDIMCSVDRKHFINNMLASYTDKPQLVAYDKTISAPHMHAKVLEHLSDRLRNGGRVLDVGSGSGYLTTCMAMAFQKPGVVVGMDCIPGFQDMAQKIIQNNYQELFFRTQFVVGDGRQGYPSRGPYHIIHVGLSAADVPQTLFEQLAPGGCLIMPIGDQSAQILCAFNKSLTGVIEKKPLCHVRYACFDDVKDMNLLKFSITDVNQCSSMSHRSMKNDGVNFDKVVKHNKEKIEKKIPEFRTALTEKNESITLQFNEKYEKISEEVLKNISNVRVSFKNVESEIKIFKSEMQNKLKEYHDQLSAKYEKIEQGINVISDKYQQSKEINGDGEKQVHPDNLTEIKNMYTEFVKLLEDQKVQIQETNMKCNEIDQQLRNVLNECEKEHLKNIKIKSSENETFEKNNLQVSNHNVYEHLEKKFNTLTDQLMKQNENVKVYDKILQIQVSIFKIEEARKEAEKKAEELKLEKLTKTLIELNKAVILIESELENELNSRGFTKEKDKNNFMKSCSEQLKYWICVMATPIIFMLILNYLSALL